MLHWFTIFKSVVEKDRELFFSFDNQENELFLIDKTNTKRPLMKEQIVDCGERNPENRCRLLQDEDQSRERAHRELFFFW